ncbi:MAG: MBL fold metallo-hydrolase [Candidatus Dormibacteraeota bacterium]|nr:MBL fold metallo-hydrolase [Candidatus Dormibacteraeota bacterium]
MNDSMQITYLGHAGLRVDGPDVSILMDGWLSPRGAFLAAWYQFPSNAHLDHRGLLDVDYVTVSHEHLDHLDESVLGRLPDRTVVLTPKYPSDNVAERLRRAGVKRLIEVPAWERFQLTERGDWLTFITEQSPMCHDAAVLVSLGGASLLHCNDARLTVGQARRAAHECGGRIDVMPLQMSGASWHPICYEYPAEEMAQISAMKRNGKFKAVGQLVRMVKPELVVPFAGPMCFLDPELQHHNRWIRSPGIFPDMQQAADFLSTRLPNQTVQQWMPGDRYDPLAKELLRDPQWADFRFDDADSYIDSYAEARLPEIEAFRAAHSTPGPELADKFVEHFRRLGELSPYFLERIDMTVRFELVGEMEGRWDVHLRPPGVKVDLGGGTADVGYRFRLDPRWLAPVMDGKIAWEDFFLSLRFQAWRDPDIYNDYLIGLLKHADEQALSAVEKYELSRANDEKIVVSSEHGNYEIARYCPHAGEDLAIGSTVVDGVIRCLGHNLEFDLKTGSCLNARCDPLFTRPLAELQTAGRAARIE